MQMRPAEAKVQHTTAMSTLSACDSRRVRALSTSTSKHIHQLSRNSSTQHATEKLYSQHGWVALIPRKCEPVKYHTYGSELQSAPTQGNTHTLTDTSSDALADPKK